MSVMLLKKKVQSNSLTNNSLNRFECSFSSPRTLFSSTVLKIITVCCDSHSQMYFTIEPFSEGHLQGSESYGRNLENTALQPKKGGLLEDLRSTCGRIAFTELIHFAGKWPCQSSLELTNLPCFISFTRWGQTSQNNLKSGTSSEKENFNAAGSIDIYLCSYFTPHTFVVILTSQLFCSQY